MNVVNQALVSHPLPMSSHFKIGMLEGQNSHSLRPLHGYRGFVLLSNT